MVAAETAFIAPSSLLPAASARAAFIKSLSVVVVSIVADDMDTEVVGGGTTVAGGGTAVTGSGAEVDNSSKNDDSVEADDVTGQVSDDDDADVNPASPMFTTKESMPDDVNCCCCCCCCCEAMDVVDAKWEFTAGGVEESPNLPT